MLKLTISKTSEQTTFTHFSPHNFRLKHDLLLPDKSNTKIVESQQSQGTFENVEIMQHFSVAQKSLLEVTKVRNDSTSSNKGVFHQVKYFSPLKL